MATEPKNKYGVKCSRCGATHVWKMGFVPTKGGRKARFKCTECAHTFYKGQPGTLIGERKRSGGRKRR